MIFLKDTLDFMRTGKPFAIQAVTREGAVRQYERCTHKKSHRSKANDSKRSPNHELHGARNIILNDRQTRTIYARLITRFNNEQVVW